MHGFFINYYSDYLYAVEKILYHLDLYGADIQLNILYKKELFPDQEFW